MVRNGFWLWYEIAILWYEMVNYGTKWLWCKIHMVRNGKRLESTTEITQNKHVKVLHYFVDDIK
jgi:hypothetical protein